MKDYDNTFLYTEILNRTKNIYDLIESYDSNDISKMNKVLGSNSNKSIDNALNTIYSFIIVQLGGLSQVLGQLLKNIHDDKKINERFKYYIICLKTDCAEVRNIRGRSYAHVLGLAREIILNLPLTIKKIQACETKKSKK